DFNCPFCYALHQRLYDLNLLDRCDWRGVQHAPHLPSPMKPWQGSLGAELRHEVAAVQHLAPGLPIALPPGKPNKDLTGDSAEEASNDSSRRIAQEWETAWHATGQAGVPLIVSPDGNLLVGCVPTEDIVRFFGTEQ